MPATWEIIHVVDRNTILDAESYQRSPQLNLNHPPGFYVVALTTPAGPVDETIGPFPSRRDALSQLGSLVRGNG